MVISCLFDEVRMVRLWLRDDQLDRIAALLPGKTVDPGRSAADNRMFVEAVLWLARTGSPWRDLPMDALRAPDRDDTLHGCWPERCISRADRASPT